MNSKDFLFTSESVSEGHPDKICDQISDAILDAHLSGDPNSRVAVETLVKNEVVVLAGEISSGVKIDYDPLVRSVIREIGYNDPALGFDAETCRIIELISAQSQDISMGVDRENDKEQGAGDQGIMFGFACSETEELMPFPILFSHKIMAYLSAVRKSGKAPFLRPDSKAQVTCQYVNGKPARVTTVVVSTQHSEEISQSKLAEFIKNEVIKSVIPASMLDSNTKYLVNPTGRFVIGGPVGDCGLTGRKIIVDTYGGYSRHGGGAFSGKDPSKVDRSAAYMARYIAKNIVKSGVARQCEVQLSYAIGVAQPLSIFVDTFGTSSVPEEKIASAISEIFDLSPRGIIKQLNLLRPIYQKTAAYGHFGREASGGLFPWEKTDKSADLAAALLAGSKKVVHGS